MTLLNNEETFLGGLLADLRRIAAAIACVALLTLFIALLFAPALEPWLCRDLRYKVCGAGAKSIDDITIAERRLLFCRLFLWFIAILAWTVLIAANMGYNLYGH